MAGKEKEVRAISLMAALAVVVRRPGLIVHTFYTLNQTLTPSLPTKNSTVMNNPGDAFEAMLTELCAKLAYMSDLNLAALEEDAASMAGGKQRDRFPVGQRILERAAQVQPPRDDASPLSRAVFANQLGLDALASGWAPELLAELRGTRRWPGAWTVKTIKQGYRMNSILWFALIFYL